LFGLPFEQTFDRQGGPVTSGLRFTGRISGLACSKGRPRCFLAVFSATRLFLRGDHRLLFIHYGALFFIRLFSADLWADPAVLPFQTVSILKPSSFLIVMLRRLLRNATQTDIQRYYRSFAATDGISTM
jgi:hypothetical protein